MFVWSSNGRFLIHSKMISFDSTLHVRDHRFLSYKTCPSLLSQFLCQDWSHKTESVDTLWATVSSKIQFLPRPYLIQGNQCVVETYKFLTTHHFCSSPSSLSIPPPLLSSPFMHPINLSLLLAGPCLAGLPSPHSSPFPSHLPSPMAPRK